MYDFDGTFIYQDEFEVNGVVVQVDADIMLPDAGEIVSEKVIPRNLSVDEIRSFIRYFAGDHNCYPLEYVIYIEYIKNIRRK